MNIAKVFEFLSSIQSKDHNIMVPSLVFDYARSLITLLQNIDRHLEFRNMHTLMSTTIQCHSCFVPAKGKEGSVVCWYPCAAEQCPSCGAVNPLAIFGERNGR